MSSRRASREADTSTSRYFGNKWIGHEDEMIPDIENCKREMESVGLAFLTKVEQKLDAKKSYDKIDGVSKDGSVYTGSAGIALLFYHAYTLKKDPNHLQRALNLIESGEKLLNGRSEAFLCGDSGIYTLGVLIANQLNNEELKTKYLAKLLLLGSKVLDTTSDPGKANEILYGRAGYLYALLFLNSEIPGVIKDATIRKILDVLFAEGRKSGGEVLYYEWHDSCYLGAAHGFFGILYVILRCKSLLDSNELKEIRMTLDWLLAQRFPSGNFPSSLGSRDDRLVQFCHGSSGAIYALIEANKIYGDALYFDAAVICAEVVWHRGLLRKGHSLCHGVAGNAYALISIYKLTHKTKYYKRGLIFCRWLLENGRNVEHDPDRPLSLFEGFCGPTYTLLDVSLSQNPKFPAFEL